MVLENLFIRHVRFLEPRSVDKDQILTTFPTLMICNPLCTYDDGRVSKMFLVFIM